MRKIRALDPFTQTKAILELSGYAQVAEDQVRAQVNMIDQRAASVMAVIPGFKVDASATTPPRIASAQGMIAQGSATASASAQVFPVQGAAFATQPPSRGGPAPAFKSQARQTIENHTRIPRFYLGARVAQLPGMQW